MRLALDRFAVLSDIHANAEAARAVIKDIQSRGIETVICLGDVVGYGPDPKECVDLIREACDLTIKGNHDEAVFFEPYFFNYYALRAIHWTRDLLFDTSDPANPARVAYLDQLPISYDQDGILFVHGSPRDPVNEYISETDVLVGDSDKLNQIFAGFEKICFVGHTHVPGVITEDMQYYEPEKLDNHFRYDGRKIVVNTGSVGQPRDGNTASSYVEVDGLNIHFHRVRYKYATTMLKIKKNQELHDHLGERLCAGV